MYKKYLKNLKPPASFLARGFFLFIDKEKSIFHQLAITYAFRLYITHTLHLIFFVFRVRPLEVEHLTVSFKS